MAHRLGIVGASGYGGAELLRLAATHPAFEVAVVAAHSQAGTPIVDLFPNLAGTRVFDAIEVGALAECDVVVLATPHDVALELGAELFDAGVRVVDLSAAFRLSVDGFATWYGGTHDRPDLATGDAAADPAAVYGLPELGHREAVRGATLVANPGCYPTATLLGLAPLAGLLQPGTIVVDAKSGTSGAGRAAKDTLHFSHVHGDLSAYGAPGHRHTGEIERWLPGDLGAVSFTPHLVPMARGLLATCYATLADGVDAAAVQDALTTAYADEPFVHVLAPGRFPHTKALAGSNGCQLSAVVDGRTGRVTVTSAIDNLGKGAAGQALQNANLMLGIEETAGLTTVGVYP
ncbi:N-acetyl-gamma-glutamyl-phosphate reductase [Nitriliruptor alkaliphilus]|uniref:N-acetyl-gamma-glutamyl-phosphate reductase n=1 Tax=Nitriliruptor alkaliphilus TaxID=427918 RepID=UPI00069620E4|nr:N-acetyl-gamma-glutamyl-phosphate reductase [Nitriliruptor alkaliphilus]